MRRLVLKGMWLIVYQLFNGVHYGNEDLHVLHEYKQKVKISSPYYIVL